MAIKEMPNSATIATVLLTPISLTRFMRSTHRMAFIIMGKNIAENACFALNVIQYLADCETVFT